MAAPLVLQFLVGATTTSIFNTLGTLLVDLNRDQPSTVSAGSNLIRCILSASGLAALQEIIDGVGIGWCFTIFAAIAATTAPILLMERHWGPIWRAKRQGGLATRDESHAGRRSSGETLGDSAHGEKHDQESYANTTTSGSFGQPFMSELKEKDIQHDNQ